MKNGFAIPKVLQTVPSLIAPIFVHAGNHNRMIEEDVWSRGSFTGFPPAQASHLLKCTCITAMEVNIREEQPYVQIRNEVRFSSDMNTTKLLAPVDAASTEDPNLTLKPTQEQIAVVAHQIYEEEGCPDGFEESHWHAAVARLQQ